MAPTQLLATLAVTLLLSAQTSADVIATFSTGMQRTYSSEEADFGPGIGPNGVSGMLERADIHEACKPLARPQQNVSAILIAKRGGCDFAVKVYTAEVAGYVAVIIFDYIQEDLFPMGGTEHVDIPSVLVSLEDGEVLAASRGILVQLTPDPFIQWPSFLVTFVVVVSSAIFMFIVFMFFRHRRRSQVVRERLITPRQLGVLPTRKFRYGDEQSSCCICLADYQPNDVIRTLPCRHEFHKDCVDPWLKDRRRCCPLCKRDPIMNESTPLLQGSTAAMGSGSRRGTSSTTADSSSIQQVDIDSSSTSTADDSTPSGSTTTNSSVIGVTSQASDPSTTAILEASEQSTDGDDTSDTAALLA